MITLNCLDYYFQLWSLHSMELTMDHKVIKQSYKKNIISMHHINYWGRPTKLKTLLSLDRMKAVNIYIHLEIREDPVPNLGIDNSTNCRMGCLLHSAKDPSTTIKIQNQILKQLGIQGPITLGYPSKMSERPVLCGCVSKTKLNCLMGSSCAYSRQEAQMRTAATEFLIHQMSHFREGFK